MASSSTRSTTGCHTCRLRKKKCDERHPICANCSSRSIPCYGYGAKPAWMKGAGVEAELVARLKKAAERNYRARRRGWRPEIGSAGRGGGSGGERAEVVGGAGSTGRGENMGSGNKSMGTGIGNGSGEMQGVIAGNASPSENMVFWETAAAGETSDLDGQWEVDDEMAHGTRRLSLSLRQRGSGCERDATTTTGTTTTDDRTFSWPRTPSPQNTSSSSSSSSSSPSHTTHTNYPPSHHPPTYLPPSPLSLPNLTSSTPFTSLYSISTPTELRLLLHYLDNVFPLQFGFSCMKRSPLPENRPCRGRDWYLAAMQVCRPMYFATLSISAHHLHLMKEGNMLVSWGIAEVRTSGEGHGGDGGNNGEGGYSGEGEMQGRVVVADGGGQGARGGRGGGARQQRTWNWDADSSFLMAVRGLQGVIDDLNARDATGVELLRLRWQVLATMCQVLSLEVFRNLGGNWPIHIEASRTFLSMMGSSTFSTHSAPLHPRGTPPQPERLDILEHLLRDDNQNILPREHTAALRHFIASFIWVDILSRATGIPPASTLSTQARPFPYLSLLEDSSLDLSLVMGCENWVFIILAQILMLEYAQCAERANPPPTSSIYLDSESDTASAGGGGDPYSLDLRSRANVLEMQLHCGLRGLLDARAARACASGMTIDAVQDVQLRSSLVTEIFALAAHTYLSVVIHGAWPWLVPVRESVNRSLTALEALPTEVLIRVSWPFAITGCMVLEEGRGRVRALVARGRATGINIGTVWKGMVVVEECWRLRDLEAEDHLKTDSGGLGFGNEVSWVEAMESLGEKILLV